MKSILDCEFKYTPSHATDIRRHIRRHKAERERAERLSRACDAWFDNSAFSREQRSDAIRRIK